MIEEILKEFTEKQTIGYFGGHTRGEDIDWNELSDWLKEKLTVFEKSIREEQLRFWYVFSWDYFKKETIDEVISYIGNKQGWEESEDIYRKHFGLKLKYK